MTDDAKAAPGGDDLDAVVAAYDRDGVVRIRGFLTAVDVTEVRGALDRYFRDVVPTLPASDVTFEADGIAVRNLWRMEKHDSFFAALAERPAIRSFVGRLVRGAPVLAAVEIFNKPARVGSGVPPHQDNAYFCQSPADMLTIWIAIDAATDGNGPIFYVRGSHAELLPHKPSGVNGNSMGLAAGFDKSDPFIGTLAPGDALVHHCQTIHYSGPNRTDHPRCGLLMVFRGSHTKDDPWLRAAYDAARAGVA